jgi:hypothetical protein
MIKQRIRYRPVKKESGYLKVWDPDMLALYTDADWANIKDRKSISGHIAILYNRPVTYSSKKQRSVLISSYKSEYIRMSTCCKQGQWIAQILRDIGCSEFIGEDANMVEIRADNQGAIALVKNPHLYKRSKYIDISYHYIRDLEE